MDTPTPNAGGVEPTYPWTTSGAVRMKALISRWRLGFMFAVLRVPKDPKGVWLTHTPSFSRVDKKPDEDTLTP